MRNYVIPRGVEEPLMFLSIFWTIKKEIARDVFPRWRDSTRQSLASMQFRELGPDLAFSLRQFLWNIYLHDDIEIAAFSGNARQALFAQSKSLTALRSRRNFKANISSERRHLQLRPQRRLPGSDLHFVNEIAAFDREIRVFREAHPQKKVATLSAAGA